MRDPSLEPITTRRLGRAKSIYHDMDALLPLKRGADYVADTIKLSLGPTTTTVLIDNVGELPISAQDGTSIANSIKAPNRLEDIGSHLMRDGISTMSKNIRDGTSTAATLAQSIIEHGVAQIATGTNAMILTRGIEAASRAVEREIRSFSQPADTSDTLISVATTCSENAALGERIAEMIAHLGPEANIGVRAEPVVGVHPFYSPGMQMNRGWYSPHLTTNEEGTEAILEDALVFITSSVIHGSETMGLLLSKLASYERPFLIIADDIDEAALKVLVVNKTNGAINAFAIQAPSYGDHKLAILEDIAVFTGGKVVNNVTMALSNIGSELGDNLGLATRVVANRRESVITTGGGSEEQIKSRMDHISTELESITDEEGRAMLRQRWGTLGKGVGQIIFGAPTEPERRELRRTLEKTIQVTRAGLREGVVAGGGIAFLTAANTLATTKWADDEQAGAICLTSSLKRPTEQIAINSGHAGSTIISQIYDLDPGYGYDAITGNYVNMKEAGIIDATSVTIHALRIACSIAVNLLKTNVAIHYAPSAKWPKAPERPVSN